MVEGGAGAYPASAAFSFKSSEVEGFYPVLFFLVTPLVKGILVKYDSHSLCVLFTPFAFWVLGFSLRKRSQDGHMSGNFPQ